MSCLKCLLGSAKIPTVVELFINYDCSDDLSNESGFLNESSVLFRRLRRLTVLGPNANAVRKHALCAFSRSVA